MENRLARNRKSPANEEKYINEYLKLNPSAKRKDHKDVAAVTTKNGEKGHGLLNEKYNRSHDDSFHRVEGFIPDLVLRKNK